MKKQEDEDGRGREGKKKQRGKNKLKRNKCEKGVKKMADGSVSPNLEMEVGELVFQRKNLSCAMFHIQNYFIAWGKICHTL